MTSITRLTLRRLKQPLIQPYKLSYRTFTEFEPYLLEIEDSERRQGFADGHISPGSSSETREGGWRVLLDLASAAVGRGGHEAKASALSGFNASKVAVTTFVTAIEVLEQHPALTNPSETTLPLLTPVNAVEPAAIEREVEDLLHHGFRTFKVKVGNNPKADLERVSAIQRAIGGRGTMRVDANRAFSRADAELFAAALNPSGIELFEQPCDADDWDAHTAVARVSTVPLMLDEPICSLADIDRAAGIPGIAFVKLKLKRFGSLERLIEGLAHAKARGIGAVLGDGLGSEIHNWLEACAARGRLSNAGEFNGFLKPLERLLYPSMPFLGGAIVMPEGYAPQLDRETVDRLTVEARTFS